MRNQDVIFFRNSTYVKCCVYSFSEKVKLHLGVHFGPVVAGVIGKKSMQFDFLGKTVNTAFNICGISKKNDVLISHDAWMQCRNSIKVTSLGPQKLKGGHSAEILKCIEVI